MKQLLSLIFVTLLLSACGGGGGSSSQSPEVSPGNVVVSDNNEADNTTLPNADIQQDTGTPPEEITEPEETDVEPEPETPEEPDSNACAHPSIEYFDNVETGLEILENFCGSREEYAKGVRHAHSGMSWEVKALYGVIAATSAYYGHEVDIATTIQIHAEAESYWHNDLTMRDRIRTGTASDEEKLVTATLLLFDYAMEAEGHNTDINRHFSLWEFVKDGDDNSFPAALLILYEFIRGGNIFLLEFRMQSDPELREVMAPFNRVF